MSINYDPFSEKAMKDPLPLYSALRAEGKPHYIEKYNAWALTRFEDVMKASTHHEKDVTFTAGQTPGQLLLGEPVLKAFTTMDAPEHRKWRGVIRKNYTPEGIEEHRERFTELARNILEPLLDKGEFDVYHDYANQVFCLNSGYNLGLSSSESISCRRLIDEMLHRDSGQVGSGSTRNQKAATELMTFLANFVQKVRANPDLAVRHTAAYLYADIDGKQLDDEELALLLLNFLIVGSETTPMVVAGMLYHLAQNTDVKMRVLNDHRLIKELYIETCRYDQPTNMLCRRAVNAFDLNGAHILPGQNLLYIYASANRDEEEFEQADTFNIFRKRRRDLSYGAGGHKCLGMHMATMGAEILVSELFKSISDYEVLEDQCERSYGEFLNGYLTVPIRVTL
ncbi:cytochrome P450 [Zhongshania aquimaris]|uniref:Cytochrome P450 n=1 Tax=Zhongshania aquimaris TaxID=2857107 RepID=A0ABS6VNK7_9GAMM|nr:cytochrome P450 [Zhongshania aquimaris]MBW2939903.1 cytochrome P450 [Zhongshania aquimaris]